MDTSFRRSASSAKSGRRRLFIVSVFAILVVLLNMATSGKISALVRDIASPLSQDGATIRGAIGGNGFFSSRSSLEAQISALQSEVRSEQLQAAAFEAMQEQNASLSALTHLAQTVPGLAAPIISSVISSPYGTFSIGAGSADNVAVGSLVLTSNGFVVGKIAQVQAHQSLVQEIFAPGVQMPVSIDGAAAVASGQGGEAQAEIPHGIAVSQNDTVVAPSLGNRPVGIVQHVDSNPANAQSAVYIALPVSLSSIEYVYVTP